jgi:hypothetical protein
LKRGVRFCDLRRTVSPGGSMSQGKLVFAQVMEHLPLTTFRRCVARYSGEHKVKSFSCFDQYLCMAFAQLTYRESLRDIRIGNSFASVPRKASGSGIFRFGERRFSSP